MGGKNTEGGVSFVAGPGATLGPYTFLRELGAGGMGRVFEVKHIELGKHVAIKLLHPALVASPKAVRRFLREGRACSRIAHPHVVEVLDTGIHEGQPYLVMELVEGIDLSQWLLDKQRLEPHELADIFLPLCSALWAAHKNGVVHRDVKPSNVILTHPRPYAMHPVLVDFGVAKLSVAEAPEDLTRTDCAVGTVAYMPPEHTRGARTAQPTSDQYALGVMLYECATGQRPFRGETQYDLMHAILHDEVVPPSQHRPDLGEAFDALVLRALNRTPAERFPSVHALGAALLSLADAKAWAAWGPEFCGTDVAAGSTQSDAESLNVLESSPAVLNWGSSAPPAAAGSRRLRRFKLLGAFAALATLGLVAATFMTPATDTAIEPKRAVASSDHQPQALATLSRTLPVSEPGAARQPTLEKVPPKPDATRRSSKAPARPADRSKQKTPNGASAEPAPEPPRGTNGAFILE